MHALLASLITVNLFLGSAGAQVLTLQQILNRDSDTRIASAGPGSPGNETNYFGPLTKAAVVRFQEKYAGDILAPAGLAQGNGYVGSYTRTKLNALIESATSTASANSAATPSATTSISTSFLPSSTNYLVNDNEKIDIYAGDKMLANIQNRIFAAINSAIASQSTATITPPTITLADVPSVVIEALSSKSAMPGTSISITGVGISSNSVVYFGNNYIVRTVSNDLFGNFSFVVPPIPPARYDIAIRTGDNISNTAIFVVSSPTDPPVHIKNISPDTITYGEELTITGSGFSPQNNEVVTTYQKFTNVPSADGKTLVIQFAPENLEESAKIGDGTHAISMSLYVVNDYGFSDSEEPFTMTI